MTQAGRRLIHQTVPAESLQNHCHPHQKHFHGMPLLTHFQRYPSDASEIQSLGYFLALAAQETQKVTFDLYFEEVEFIRPGILQSQKDVQKVLNSQNMKQMSTSLSKQFFFFFFTTLGKH